jgi:hypothetical protein
MQKSKKASANIETLLGQLADMLAARGAPAVSAYDLGQYVFLRGKDAWHESDAKAVFVDLCDALLRVRLLSAIEPLGDTKAYLLFGKGDASPADIVCSLDPFAYVSHLSAMEYHGLTDRFPKILYMTRPALPQWRDQAKTKMSRDLGDHLQPYLDSGLPKLIMPKISRLGQTSIQFFERSQLGAFRLVSGSSLRVATIGRVFLEMIREPSLCGGIQHVIDIYKREAGRYLSLIIDEVNQHGLPIDKVRLGFLLSEVCGLDHPLLNEWDKLAQRGGSRKLDPEGEYLPVFSERWQLSLNVSSLSRSTDDA